MTKQRDWKKIKYYPVSIEKLMNASMREAAYLIAPVNIGEDYEYFDKVKHLLDIPPEPKTLEEIQQEFDEKIDALIKTTKWKFAYSKEGAEKNYNAKFDRIIQDFEYARKNGEFMPKVSLGYGIGVNSFYAAGSCQTSFVIRQGDNHKGYYTFGNQQTFKYYMNEKPNAVVRFFMNKLLGFKWIDETT